jgi:hypothetical protein
MKTAIRPDDAILVDKLSPFIAGNLDNSLQFRQIVGVNAFFKTGVLPSQTVDNLARPILT